MNNVHEDQPVVFQTRWTLSYLRGPLTREQIQTLMAPRKQAGRLEARRGASRSRPRRDVAIAPEVAGSGLGRRSRRGRRPARGAAGRARVLRPAPGPGRARGIARCTAPRSWAWPGSTTPTRRRASTTGRPWPCSSGSARRCRRRSGPSSEPYDDGVPELDKAPEAGARFAPLPSELARAKSYAEWTKSLKNYLYRERTLDLWTCPDFKETSRPSESEREFRLRLAQASRERRDQEVEELRAKYAPKQAALEDQIRRAARAAGARAGPGEPVDLGRHDRDGQLGAGRAPGPQDDQQDQRGPRPPRAAKAAGRAVQQHGDVGQAGESLEVLRQKYAELEAKFQEEVDELDPTAPPRGRPSSRPLPLRPRKADITVEQVVLAWTPVEGRGHGEAGAGVVTRPSTTRLRDHRGQCSPTQPGRMPFAFGRIVKTVSFAARKSPAAPETPSGGVAMTVIWPPFVNICFPAMVKMTAFLDAIIGRLDGDGLYTGICFFLPRWIVLTVTW